MEKNFFTRTLADHTGTTLGTEVLRDILIPAIVGKNEDILYWSGKFLARKLLLASNNDLRLFFKYAGWGTLKLIKSKKELDVFELSGDIIKTRLNIITKPDFQLEAGFIAETYQLHNNFVTEGCVSKIDDHQNLVTFNIKTDKHAPLQPEKFESESFSMIEFDKLQKAAQKINNDKKNK